MCCERVTIDVVGEALGGDPAAVVADHRHRREPAAPRLGQRLDQVLGVAAGREHDQRVAARARRRSPGAGRSPRRRCRWRSRSGSRGPRSGRSPGAIGHPCGAGCVRSATRSIASVAEPPLPQASSLPPGVQQRAQLDRRRGQRARGSRRASARAARRPRPPSSGPSRGRRRSPRRGRSRTPTGTGRGSSRRRRRGPARASRPASRPRWSKKTCTSSQSTW